MASKRLLWILVVLLAEMKSFSNAFTKLVPSRRPPGYNAIGSFDQIQMEPQTLVAKTGLAMNEKDEESNLVDNRSKNVVRDDTTQVQKKSTGRRILDLSVPALGALLIDPLLTLADTAFVGHFSDTAYELAGMGSAAALLTFSFYVFNFLCTATTPLVSEKRAANKEAEALAVGGQALSLAFLLGSILAASLIAFREPLLAIMGTTISGPEATGYGMDFLVIRALAAPAVFCISASTGVLRGYLDTKTPIYVLVLANLVNLALDILLIVYFHMGPAGAAIATTTAEWISAILFLGVLAAKLPSADGELGKRSSGESLVVTPTLSVPQWQEVKPLVVASSSVFLRSFSLQLTLSAAAAFAARGGETVPGGTASSISAHQVAIQLWVLCSFIADALAAASQGLVADGLGRQDQGDVKDVTKTVFLYSTFLGLILAGMLEVGYASNFLLGIFTSDVGTQAALIEILPLIILAQPLNSIVFAADGVLQGASEFTYQAKSMAFSVGATYATFVALQYFGKADTLVDVWIALITLQLMRGLTSAVKIFDRDGPINLLESK